MQTLRVPSARTASTAESVLLGLITTSDVSFVTKEYFKAKSRACFSFSVLFAATSASSSSCFIVK